MLEGFDFSKADISKSDYKTKRDALIEQLVLAQQAAITKQRGVVVLFEGWAGAGKGTQISDIVYNLDARATDVYVTADIDSHDARYFNYLNSGVTGYRPLMQEFWQALGRRGHTTFFDRGWYTKAVEHSLCGALPYPTALRSIEDFERTLVADGYAVIKLFFHMSHKAQLKRLRKLHDNPATAWRAPQEKIERTRHYDDELMLYNRLLDSTSYDFAPWIILNAEDKRQTTLTILQALLNALNGEGGVGGTAAAANNESEAMAESSKSGDTATDASSSAKAPAHLPQKNEVLEPALRVEDFRYDLAISAGDYKRELKSLQKRLFDLEAKMYLKRIPLIVMYEGWDAAGKGGNIKRVAQALDARAYKIYPSPAPTPDELAHPHLWRYWTRLPKAGHVGIYDRSWYGRVLVERIEGFTSEARWREGYEEINNFERDLTDWGAILIKFWVDISQDEQLARFNARAADPLKQWKLTDEDWRNREKYPEYAAAINEMFERTNTPWAPWHVLESNDKRYARIKALRIIIEALEERLQE
jgi:polyphosphate:AMP phosphotransferase